jgi:hypothetical protein
LQRPDDTHNRSMEGAFHCRHAGSDELHGELIGGGELRKLSMFADWRSASLTVGVSRPVRCS